MQCEQIGKKGPKQTNAQISSDMARHVATLRDVESDEDELLTAVVFFVRLFFFKSVQRPRLAQMVLDSGGVRELVAVAVNPSSWALEHKTIMALNSVLVAANTNQARTMIDLGLVDVILKAVRGDNEEVRAEALLVTDNMCLTMEFSQALLEADVVQAMCEVQKAICEVAH